MTDHRLVLFADLLGFKALVRSIALPELVKRYNRVFSALYAAGVRLQVRGILGDLNVEAILSSGPALKGAEDAGPRAMLDALHKDTEIAVVVMSDSFVIYSEPIEREDPLFEARLVSLVLFGRILLMRLFNAHLPARAALSYGAFHADQDNGIYVGEGLVDAYELAESQNWIGGVVAPCLVDQVARLLDKHEPTSLSALRPYWDVVRYNVPLKSGLVSHYAINWVSAWNYCGPVREDFFEDVLTGDERIDIKYHNTLAFMRHVGSSA